MKTFTRNLDHTKIIQVEEYTTYQQAEQSLKRTACASQVKFSSGFNVGIRNKIEDWSRTKFDENIKKSRLGMIFVMQELEKSKALL